MHDHLKDAAIAAAMNDDELVAAFYAMDDQNDPTGLQQAIIDEMLLRRIPEFSCHEMNVAANSSQSSRR
jgi:hypothetical protein